MFLSLGMIDVLLRFQDSEDLWSTLSKVQRCQYNQDAVDIRRGSRGGAVPESVSGKEAFCIFGHEIPLCDRRDLLKSSECHFTWYILIYLDISWYILIYLDILYDILAFLRILNLEPIHSIRAEFGQVLMWNCIHPSACVQAQLRPWELLEVDSSSQISGKSSVFFDPSPSDFHFSSHFSAASGPWMMSQCSSESYG